MAVPRLSAAAWALVVALAAPALAVAAECGDLKRLRLKDVEITAATAVAPAPTWKAPQQRLYNGVVSTPFCRVEGVIEGVEMARASRRPAPKRLGKPRNQA